ncbi:MAG: class I SAM-dependent methyltransferase [Planctomycetota bacterium]
MLRDLARHQVRVYSDSRSAPPPWQETLLRHKADILERCIAALGTSPRGACAILDVGCNDGAMLALLERPGRALLGIDLSPACVEKANLRPGVRAQVADASTNLPFPAAEFDLVVSSEIIEHIYDTDRFCREMRRVLKDGGLAFVSTPNVNCLRNRLLVPLGRYPYGPGCSREGEGHATHVRAYNMRALAAQLGRNGFEIVLRACTHVLPISVSAFRLGYRLNCALGSIFPTLGSDIIVVARKR